MLLTFSGSPTVHAPRPLVWSRVMDPKAVAACASGVESVDAIDPRHYRVVSAFGVGAVKLRFTMEVELSDIVEPERASIVARGKAPGSAVSVRTDLRLEEAAPGTTRLHWTANADFSGTVASVGARLLQGTARKLTEQFWKDFAKDTEVAARKKRPIR